MKNYFKKSIYLVVMAASFAAHAGSFEDFFRAVRGDNASGVRTLLNRGFDPNTRDEHGQTGLLLALREPSPKVVQVLMESPQLNVDLANAKDETPLMLASIKGQQDLVVQLLKRDAAVNKTGWAPLHYAASSGQLSIMKLLLENHAFIDAQSPNGTTPLMMAAMYGSNDAVKLLLAEGADTAMKNQLGMTAVDFAVKANRAESAELIKAAGDAKANAVKAVPKDGKW
ncbi:ankyrin repeat domain-containing protein [Variovorax sp. EBFNA2]|uniref:ankyrin repeat domain-containing protein n=1 Tax=Variovorax sp. EBFNA2 TaxID=3342097 RepID=UPI0029BFCC67|nr:ankyrin repeat domain-containing protein [Variovorax boronicumulans]WPG40577.1 ankyrin repeat domain-containing protein [Variovorax boronicumulans]